MARKAFMRSCASDLAQRVRITQLPRSDKVYERLNTVRPFYKFADVRNPQKGRVTRLPVILRLERRGRTTEIMVVHTKSKISDLKKASQWERKDKKAVLSAILSRQKLSVEMNVIRKYIAHRLYSQKAEAVIVMGDMNDGVTRDIIDESYLLHSIVHELRGAFHHELALMRHVLDGRQLQRKPYAWTVEFRDRGRRRQDHARAARSHDFQPSLLRRREHLLRQEQRTDRAQDIRQARGQQRQEPRRRPSDHKPLSATFTLM